MRREEDEEPEEVTATSHRSEGRGGAQETLRNQARAVDNTAPTQENQSDKEGPSQSQRSTKNTKCNTITWAGTPQGDVQTARVESPAA